jgi:hypothetical protein
MYFKASAVDLTSSISNAYYSLKSTIQKEGSLNVHQSATRALGYFAKNVPSVYCAHHFSLSSDTET